MKGCGACDLPTVLINDIDMASVSFRDLNKICTIIDPNKQGGECYTKYVSCIEKIKHSFQYPQYYNGVIGLLLLFSHDESYALSNPIRVKEVFEETKRVAMAGYEDFADFGSHTIDNLISTLREMSDIFRILHGTNLSFNEKAPTKEISEIECYVNKKGKRMQIKPINYSTKATVKRSKTEQSLNCSYQLIQMNNPYEFEKQIIRSFKKFEQIFASVTSGYILTTNIGKYIMNSVHYQDHKHK